MSGRAISLTSDATAAVRYAVAHGDAFGGIAIGPGGATIVTAGAQGPAASQVIDGALTALANQAGRSSHADDVNPLPARDSFGLSGFMIVIGLTLASMIFAAISFATRRELHARALLTGTAAFALLAGAVDHFPTVTGFGTLLSPGHGSRREIGV